MAIVSNAALGGIEDLYAAADALCERHLAALDGVIPALNESVVVLTEADIGSMLKAIAKWLRDLAHQIMAFIRRALNAIRGRYESRIPRAEAQGVSPEIVASVHAGLSDAERRGTAEHKITAGQLLRRTGWQHPTDLRKFDVHACAGAGLAAAAVIDFEKALSAFYMDVTGAIISIGAEMALDSAITEIHGRTAAHGGYSAREVEALGLDKWYLGKPVEASISSMWYTSAAEKIKLVERDIEEVQRNKPGESVAAKFDEMSRKVAADRKRFSNPQNVVDTLRKAGNRVVAFHNGIVKGMLAGYQELASFQMTCLNSVIAPDLEGHAAPAVDRPALTYRETVEYLNEGLGNVIKNLATGDVEEEIEELRNEAKDIHTPEQQRYVLTKIVRLMEKLIILRHNPSGVRQFVHNTAAFFQRMFGNQDAGKELSTRMGEAIRDLAKLRDQVLAKKWQDPKWNEEVEKLKDRAAELLDNAASKSTGDEM